MDGGERWPRRDLIYYRAGLLYHTVTTKPAHKSTFLGVVSIAGILAVLLQGGLEALDNWTE